MSGGTSVLTRGPGPAAPPPAIAESSGGAAPAADSSPRLRGLFHAVLATDTQRRLADPRRRIATRALDIACALGLLVALAPVLLLIALLVRLDSPGPALFRQPRHGLGGRPFLMFKFRTMRRDAGDPTGSRATLPADARVTRLGRFLRRTSLDELPQLFNVLRGEMAMVGPRPHPLAMTVNGIPYREVAPGYMARHCVKPGITGLAQVSGARGLVHSPEQARRRLMLDFEYILNRSTVLDLAIIARTFRTTLSDPAAY